MFAVAYSLAFFEFFRVGEVTISKSRSVRQIIAFDDVTMQTLININGQQPKYIIFHSGGNDIGHTKVLVPKLFALKFCQGVFGVIQIMLRL